MKLILDNVALSKSPWTLERQIKILSTQLFP